MLEAILSPEKSRLLNPVCNAGRIQTKCAFRMRVPHPSFLQATKCQGSSLCLTTAYLWVNLDAVSVPGLFSCVALWPHHFAKDANLVPNAVGGAGQGAHRTYCPTGSYCSGWSWSGGSPKVMNTPPAKQLSSESSQELKMPSRPLTPRSSGKNTPSSASTNNTAAARPLSQSIF